LASFIYGVSVERNIIVTIWFSLSIFGCIFFIFIYLLSFIVSPNNENFFAIKDVLLYVAHCIAAILILNWINGFWIIVIIAGIQILTEIIAGYRIGYTIFGNIIGCLLNFAVLQLKKNGISAWSLLTGKEASNVKYWREENIFNKKNSPKKKKLSVTDVKCLSCGNIVEAGYIKCPYCEGELSSE
jgi:hypothetical protein